MALAGAVGTLSRYALAGAAQRVMGAGFPWGTLAVNLTGCFVIGTLAGLLERQVTISPELRAVVFIGFMGAFTTFSTYMLETSDLLRDGEWLRAMMNVTLQNLGGFAALIGGFALARSM